MDELSDLYKLLGIQQNATPDSILKAFRKKSKLYHPDKNPNLSSELMQKLNEARATLLDSNERAKYDDKYKPTGSGTPMPEREKIFLCHGERLSDTYRRLYADRVAKFPNLLIINNSHLLAENLQQLRQDLALLRANAPGPDSLDEATIQRQADEEKDGYSEEEYRAVLLLLYGQKCLALARHLSLNPCHAVVKRLLAEHAGKSQARQQPAGFRACLLLLEATCFMGAGEFNEASIRLQRALLMFSTADMCWAIATLLRFNYVHLAIDNLGSFMAMPNFAIPQMALYAGALTPNSTLKMVREYEHALLTNDSLSALEQALLYVDLSMASPPYAAIVNNYLLAAVLLEKSMSNSSADPAHAYACFHVITALLEGVVVAVHRNLDPGSGVYFLKHAYVCLHQAATHLECSLSGAKNTAGKREIMISSIQEKLLQHTCAELVRLMRICPLLDLPLSLSGDFIFLDLIATNFLDSFYQYQVQEKPQHPYGYLYHYHLLEITVHGTGSKEENFDSRRVNAMRALLEHRGWTMKQVDKLMRWTYIMRSGDGWWETNIKELQLVGDTYDSVEGVCIDINEGTFELLLTKAPNGKKGLFNMNDVMDILGNGITSTAFTLDPADNELHYHPFMQQKFSPNSLHGSNYLRTLLHADYLLKMLSTGCEVSSHAPFGQRGSDELLRCLSPELRQALRDFHLRPAGSGVVHRFWIESDECPYWIEDTDNDETVTYTLGQVGITVRTHRIERNSEGELVDADDSENSDDDYDEETGVTAGQAEPRRKTISPELKLARALTDHVDELGSNFPVLPRLRELLKLGAVGAILRGTRDNLRKFAADDSHRLKRVTDGLCNIRTQIVYPRETNAEVERHYRLALQQQNCPADQVSPANESEVKSNFRGQLQSLDAARLASCTSQIPGAFGVMNVPGHVTSYIRTWLLTGDGQQLVAFLVGALREQDKAQCKRFENNLTACGFSLSGTELGALTETQDCSWIPSAFYTHGRGQVYGGVLLGLSLLHMSASGGAPGGGESNARGGGSGGGGSSSGGGGSASGRGPRGRGSRQTKRVHTRNRLDYVGESHVYAVKEADTGRAVEIGITSTGFKKTLDCEGKQVLKRAAQKAARYVKQTGKVYVTEVRHTFTRRWDAYVWETNAVARGRALFGSNFLPGNIDPINPARLANSPFDL